MCTSSTFASKWVSRVARSFDPFGTSRTRNRLRGSGPSDPNTSSRPGALVAWALALALGLLWMAGCTETRTSSGYYRPLAPEPRPLEPPPPDARANALVLNLSAAPVDTNGNGYPDLIYATAHLFDTRYPPAFWEDGAMVFRMYPPGQAGEPDPVILREWRFEGEALDRARALSAFGGCYHFQLSLLDGGTDKLPVGMADVMCSFEPADGRDPTFAGEVTSIRIGRRILVPQLRWEESAAATRLNDAAQEPEPAMEPVP
jgi:hypothetical protein